MILLLPNHFEIILTLAVGITIPYILIPFDTNTYHTDTKLILSQNNDLSSIMSSS